MSDSLLKPHNPPAVAKKKEEKRKLDNKNLIEPLV